MDASAVDFFEDPLLVDEPMSNTPGARRVGDAYIFFDLLAIRSGRARMP